ncbi:MAG: helix-turn-helix domain-containing protein [Eubacteriaceae bacterium]|nr:helix-turn-helix domain-containing protein [Eubacteriaceae bacterium]
MDNVPVLFSRLYESGSKATARKGTLYICDILPAVFEDGCSYLLTGKSIGAAIAPNCDAAFIDGHASQIALLYEVQDICASAQAWDIELKDALAAASSLTQVFAVGSKLFSYPFFITDRNYTIAELTPSCIEAGYFSGMKEDQHGHLKMPIDLLNLLMCNPDFSSMQENSDVFSFVFDFWMENTALCMNIISRGQYLACIVADCGGLNSPGLIHLYKHLCEYIKKAYLAYTDDALAKHQNDKLHRTVKSMLSDEPGTDHSTAVEALKSYGWLPWHEIWITVISLTDGRDVAPYISNHFESAYPESCAVMLNENIVWLINWTLSESTSEGNIRQAIISVVRDLVCKAANSRGFHDISQLKIKYKHALYAMQKGSQANSQQWMFDFPDYEFDYMADAVRHVSEEEDLCHKGLLKLKEYDKNNNTDLTSLLYNFILSCFNVNETSSRAFIHRVTLNRRLKKIKEILGYNWESQKDLDMLTHILMSYKIINGSAGEPE